MNVINLIKYIIAILIFFTNSSCDQLKSGQGALVGSQNELLGMQIEPFYPQHGAQWNDYVAADGVTIFDASDSPCDANSTQVSRGYYECIHGGQMRHIINSNRNSCNGITAKDSQGVFKWQCRELIGSIELVSTAINDGFGLANLITIDSNGLPQWRTLSLYVYYQQEEVAHSLEQVWFNNPIVHIQGGQDLDQAGTVYVVTNSVEIDEDDPYPFFRVLSDKIAFTVLPPAVVSNRINNHNQLILALGTLQADGTVDYLWLEGTFYLQYENETIDIQNARFLHARNITLTTNGVSKVELNVMYTSRSFINNINAAGFTIDGIRLSSITHNYIYNLIAANNDDLGINIGAISATGPVNDNTFYNITATGNYSGLISNSENNYNNRFANIVAAANNNYGILIGQHNVLMNATSVNNQQFGIICNHDFTILNTVSANNGRSTSCIYCAGLRAQNYGAMYFHNIVSAHNNIGILLQNSDNNYFSSLFAFGDNAEDCYINGSNPGIDLNCQFSHSAQTLKEDNIHLSSSFVGKANELSNPQELSANDWLNFERPYRFWGKEGGNFPNPDNEGNCVNDTTCRLWDFNLRTTDTALKNRNQQPSDTKLIYHRWKIQTSTECQQIAGAIWANQICDLPGYDTQVACEAAGGDFLSNKCFSVFLPNAVELFGDHIGNDNILCEVNETCVFSPNIGAYQGHGEYTTLTQIPISGQHIDSGTIVLISFAINGY
ncbi:MAG: hypothetical protein JW841_06830 [Deltaproteobacteria bacterium]|nr:hypothetical protein [Deltaproteobacteria bacterium]